GGGLARGSTRSGRMCARRARIFVFTSAALASWSAVSNPRTCRTTLSPWFTMSPRTFITWSTRGWRSCSVTGPVETSLSASASLAVRSCSKSANSEAWSAFRMSRICFFWSSVSPTPWSSIGIIMPGSSPKGIPPWNGPPIPTRMTPRGPSPAGQPGAEPARASEGASAASSRVIRKSVFMVVVLLMMGSVTILIEPGILACAGPFTPQRRLHGGDVGGAHGLRELLDVVGGEDRLRDLAQRQRFRARHLLRDRRAAGQAPRNPGGRRDARPQRHPPTGGDARSDGSGQRPVAQHAAQTLQVPHERCAASRARGARPEMLLLAEAAPPLERLEHRAIFEMPDHDSS